MSPCDASSRPETPPWRTWFWSSVAILNYVLIVAALLACVLWDAQGPRPARWVAFGILASALPLVFVWGVSAEALFVRRLKRAGRFLEWDYIEERLRQNCGTLLLEWGPRGLDRTWWVDMSIATEHPNHPLPNPWDDQASLSSRLSTDQALE